MFPFVNQAIEIGKKHLEDKSEVSYFFMGKICPVYELNSRLARTAADYQLIIKDLEIVGATLETAVGFTHNLKDAMGENPKFSLKNVDMIVLNSLLITAIVTYWKCFAESDKRRAKVQDVKLQAELPEKLYKLHHLIKSERHTFVAHAGMNKRETGKPVLIFHPDFVCEPLLELHVSHEHFSFSKNIPDFIELTNYVIGFAKELQEEKRKALKEIEIAKLDFKTVRDQSAKHIIFHD